MKKYIVPAIGVVAFVIGGLVAREQVLEAADVLEKKFGKNQSTPETSE